MKRLLINIKIRIIIKINEKFKLIDIINIFV